MRSVIWAVPRRCTGSDRLRVVRVGATSLRCREVALDGLSLGDLVVAVVVVEVVEGGL